MKMNTYLKPAFTADYYDFTTTLDAQGGTLYFYSFKESLTFFAHSDGFGRVSAILKDNSLGIRTPGQFRNFKDRKGQELMAGAVWTVDSIQPILNWNSQVDGYSLRMTYDFASA